MHFTIAADHPSLPGHFPGRPLVPGVLLLDRVVEAIEAGHGPIGALRLPQVKFLQPLLPGEVARVELESVGAPGTAPRWRFRVWRDDTLLASGEVASAQTLATAVTGADVADVDAVGGAAATANAGPAA